MCVWLRRFSKLTATFDFDALTVSIKSSIIIKSNQLLPLVRCNTITQSQKRDEDEFHAGVEEMKKFSQFAHLQLLGI